MIQVLFSRLSIPGAGKTVDSYWRSCRYSRNYHRKREGFHYQEKGLIPLREEGDEGDTKWKPSLSACLILPAWQAPCGTRSLKCGEMLPHLFSSFPHPQARTGWRLLRTGEVKNKRRSTASLKTVTSFN